VTNNYAELPLIIISLCFSAANIRPASIFLISNSVCLLSLYIPVLSKDILEVASFIDTILNIQFFV
jgi:hypothetical protein